MMTGLVRTVTGDLPADELGPTYAHEHLIIDSPLIVEHYPEIHLPSVGEAMAEVETCIAQGVRTMVDAMPCAAGRDSERLAEISIRTGMRIIAMTGLHTARYYQDVEWTREESVEGLADRFIADIEVGIDAHDYLGPVIDRTEHRAGVIKVGTLTEELTDHDREVFAAAAIASEKTGAPVLTHTEGGLGGAAQVEALLGAGMKPDRIVLSHVDKVVDPAYHEDLLSSGVYLCYDQALRWKEENHTAALAAAMVEAGHGDRILLGTDGARRTLWATLRGSPGLAWLHGGFIDVLREAGIDQAVITGFFVANPTRFFALQPA